MPVLKVLTAERPGPLHLIQYLQGQAAIATTYF